MITVGDKTLPWREGLCLADILREADLPDAYAFANLNGKFIWRKDWETTRVPDGAKIRFHMVIAGG